MKRLALIAALCLMPHIAGAQSLCSTETPCEARMQQGIAGVVVQTAAGYCSTCTGTADADVLCESFEGSSLCAATYDSNCICASTWTARLTGATNSIDTTSTHNGTIGCTDAGSNAIQFVRAETGQVAFQFDYGSASNNWYIQGYLNVVSEGLADAASTYILLASPDSSATNVSFGLQVVQGSGGTSGQVRLRGMYYNGTSVTNDIGTPQISTGTWYPFRIQYQNNTASGFQWWVDYNNDGDFGDANEDEGANTTGDRAPQYLWIGMFPSDSDLLTVQMDNVKVDDDAMPSVLCAR